MFSVVATYTKQRPINLTAKVIFFSSLINDLRISITGYQILGEEAGE